MYTTQHLKDIHYLHAYNPLEPQYCRYSSYIIAAGHKIVDVYESICAARLNLTFFECNEFGQLVNANDQNSVKYAKSIFITNSLFYYNICIDLSWQVLWVYYNIDSLDLMYDDAYIKSTKDCDYKTLIQLLKYKASFHTSEKNKILNFIKHITNFLNDIEKVRDKYNYMKHRGSFHIDGLGMNDDCLPFNLFGIKPLMLKQEVLSIDEWYDILIQFDKKFIDYFEVIVNNIMPKDYLDTQIDIDDILNYGVKLQEYLKSKENK